MALAAKPELVFDTRCDLGESPVWDPGRGALHWADITAGCLWTGRVGAGFPVSRHVADPVTAVVPTREGGLLAGDRDGLLSAPGPDGPFGSIASVGLEPGLRFNDGKCDSAGRLWIGTMHYDLLPGRGTLYRVGPDLAFRTMVEGLDLSNGIGWSPDERRMYLVDSLAGCVYVFDFDPAAGELGNRRRFVSLATSRGLFDGLAVDAEGCVWVAVAQAAEVRRYTPSGRLDARVRVPVTSPTSCAFGDSDMSTLFVTSARVGLPPDRLEKEPIAGGVVAIRTSVGGQAVGKFNRG